MVCVGTSDGLLELPSFRLEAGGQADIRLSYRVHGAGAKSNPLVLFPHQYSATPASLDSMVGRGRPLDPTRYCVICPAQLGPHSFGRENDATTAAARLTIGDDVRAQRQLVAEHFGDRPVSLVIGFSMGALQAIEWAVQAPAIARLVVIAGTAATPPHSKPILGALRACLSPAADAPAGSAAARAATGAHARMIAALAIPRAAYRDGRWRALGYDSADDFIQAAIVADYESCSVRELLCQLGKWERHDVGRRFRGDLDQALRSVQARTRYIALKDDRLFPYDDVAEDQRQTPRSDLRALDTHWGHYGFAGFDSADISHLDQLIAEVLESPAPRELEQVS